MGFYRQSNICSKYPRELADRAFSRVLIGWGGPLDGESLTLDAGESSIEFTAGRYVAIGSSKGERLEWRVD